MRRIQIHKAGVGKFAANLLGFGITRGNRLVVEGGVAKGCRITIGLWFYTVTVWITQPEITESLFNEQ
jgi:hypothetical protein